VIEPDHGNIYESLAEVTAFALEAAKLWSPVRLGEQLPALRKLLQDLDSRGLAAEVGAAMVWAQYMSIVVPGETPDIDDEAEAREWCKSLVEAAAEARPTVEHLLGHAAALFKGFETWDSTWTSLAEELGAREGTQELWDTMMQRIARRRRNTAAMRRLGSLWAKVLACQIGQWPQDHDEILAEWLAQGEASTSKRPCAAASRDREPPKGWRAPRAEGPARPRLPGSNGKGRG
jgi:hypothetical protein